VLFFYFFLLSKSNNNECRDESIPDPFSLVNCGDDKYLPINNLNQSSQSFSEDFSRRLNNYVLNQIPKYFLPNTPSTNSSSTRFDREQNIIPPELPSACYFLCKDGFCQSPIQFPPEEICLNPKVTQNTVTIMSFENYRNKKIEQTNYNKNTPIYNDFLEYNKDPSVFVDLMHSCTNFYKKENLLLNEILLNNLFSNINFCQYNSASSNTDSNNLVLTFIQEKQKTCSPATIIPKEASLENPPQQLPNHTPSTSPKKETPPVINPKDATNVTSNSSTPTELLSTAPYPQTNPKTYPDNLKPDPSSETITTVSPSPTPTISITSNPTISLTDLLSLLISLTKATSSTAVSTPYAPSYYPPAYPNPYAPYPNSIYAQQNSGSIVNTPYFMGGFPGYGFPYVGPYTASPLVPGFFQPSGTVQTYPQSSSNQETTSAVAPEKKNSNIIDILLNSF
jgi:hypothetical protein